MKSLYTTLLLVGISSAVSAQKKPYGYARLPQVDNKVVYTAIIPATGTSQEVLYARAKQWINQNITGSPDTSRTRNKEEGILIAHGLLRQPPVGIFKDPNSYAYACTVAVKDGKYKYQIDHIQWTYSTMNVLGDVIQGPYTLAVEFLGTMPPNYADDRAAYLDEQAKALIKSLEEVMVPKTSVTW
ncbi:DUF4468 domain-containing protein [Hymenobacter cellulosilyticus]|uniref:DUF4468 domain-containing protein n=1 Tax=Hymenobacter cellulosilyticus TaxID=2932248 RepID=A0A8T9QF76_9BACT|nr:DUF4468 domain-containing protein [Hymenobacter cellulosilyticus]UOQ74470.1 DUF4468 domain-containing protein [Hymenobacter cellulosilyticus]